MQPTEESMTSATLEVDFTLDAEFFEDLLDTAGYGIGYWAESGSIELKDEDGDEIIYRVKEQEGDEFVITKQDLESVISEVVSGRLQVGKVLKNDLALLCLGDDDIDIDATDADTLIQLACFREVVYG
jgi:hypothetical protein